MSEKLAVILKAALLAGVIAICGAVGYFVTADRKLPEAVMERASITVGKDGVETTVTNIHITEKTDRDEMWELKAKGVSANAATTEMKEVKMYYHTSGHGIIELSADKGVMFNDTQNITFTGDVTVKSPRPMLLSTERLDWNVETGEFTTDEQVTVRSNGSTVEGKGMVVHLARQDVTVLNAVTARIQ